MECKTGKSCAGQRLAPSRFPDRYLLLALTSLWLMGTASPLGAQYSADSWISFSRDGLALGAADEAFSAQVHFRGQFRYSNPLPGAPRSTEDFRLAADDELEIRRGRVKGGGHILKPWLAFKFEHSLLENRSLDAKLTFAKVDWLQLSAGQWKVDYQREQIGSSGDQQFVERSIVNRAFTFNRQKGAAAHGRIGEGRPWDSQYWSGVFLGNGRGFLQDELTDQDHGDGKPMWVSRYQWNALNGGVDFSQSDLERSPVPRLSLALGAALNRSRYTRFSGAGGGQLDDFARGERGQYAVSQRLFDAAFKYQGFSFQHEAHWKRITDRATGRVTQLRAAYAQAGYFLHEMFPIAPRPLELAARWAFVDRSGSSATARRSQLGMAINWFFEGHDNKLTLDLFQHRLAQPAGELTDLRVRIQWDITI